MTRPTARPLKFTASCLAGIACAAVLLSLAATPASAREVHAAAIKTQPPLTDISARRKHRTLRVAATPQPHPMWSGADPTKGPGAAWVREQQRSGRCIMDEGYGRWTACSNM